ncbi:hypothetical protein [Bacillus sp. B-jedd]|uniref:hypothetical protein n=1 Tax=Bacillus sp. B-jedd TaxID=1476857 RepID=UPI0005156F60|nr:hypothetical protein [Bacillus sp. B-jedd]CEG27199.1 hypothetical protein BN1002_02055 [Bacillus sp. B-jedd]
MDTSHPLLIDVLPNLATRIRNYFITVSRKDLADHVEHLQIQGLCECGDPDCGSFYLANYSDNEELIEGFNFEDIGSIEVYEGKIGFIEIFPSQYGYSVRSKLKERGIFN